MTKDELPFLMRVNPILAGLAVAVVTWLLLSAEASARPGKCADDVACAPTNKGKISAQPVLLRDKNLGQDAAPTRWVAVELAGGAEAVGSRRMLLGLRPDGTVVWR